MYVKVTGVLQTVALLATLGHISLVSVWTARTRGMTAVRSVTKTSSVSTISENGAIVCFSVPSNTTSVTLKLVPTISN